MLGDIHITHRYLMDVSNNIYYSLFKFVVLMVQPTSSYYRKDFTCKLSNGFMNSWCNPIHIQRCCSVADGVLRPPCGGGGGSG